jgi:hypothetical protein
MKKSNMRLLKSILIALLLTSCSANWHIKRALKKDPSIMTYTLVFDTVIIKKDRVLHDTFHTTEYDTVVMEDSFVYTKVIREKDIIKVYSKCKADTVRITKTLPPQVNYIEKKNDWKKSLDWLLIIFGLLALTNLLKFVSKWTSN